MSSDISAPVIARAIIEGVIALRGATYLAIIALCLLVYDLAITIDQEVKFVWSQRWSFGKVVYIFIRYATILMMAMHVASLFFFDPSPPLRRAVGLIFTWSEVVIIIAGSSVFVVRTWLLWGGAKWVLFALIGGLALSSALSIYYISIDLQGFRIIPTVSPQLLPGCLFRVSPTIWRPILFPFLYETFVIALTVTKVMMTPNRVPVVMRLFLDGTLYYVVVATVLLLTTIGAAYTPTRVLVIGSGFHTACISVGCSRLVLSLHSWAHENKPRSVAHSSQTRLDVHKHRISTPSFSTHSKGPAPTQPQYELVPRTAPDIGVGRVTTSTTATSVPGAIRFSLPHRDVPNLHSVLPDIERPSLPTRMWTNSSAVHTRESQRSYRPPRSSSLYPVMLTDQWNEPVQPLTYPTGAEENRERKGHSLIEGQRLRPLSIQRTYNVI